MAFFRISTAAVAILVCNSALSTELNPIIVTATRTAQTADETLSSVSIINRQEIEQQQAKSVQDILRGLPGISIANNGGRGKATSVFLRGTESDHLLVLIDGVKTGSATRGTTAFQHIPIEQIERIEVVRGPRSSLYGSEAIGGVIQIFTRKGGGVNRPFFSIGAGSDQTYEAAAGVSGGGDRGWFNLSASGFDTQGFNACNGKPSPGGAGCFTNEPDRDGYTNLTGSLNTGNRFNTGLEIDLNVLRTNGDNESDGNTVNESESVQEIIGGTLLGSLTDFWHVSLATGRSTDESKNSKDGAFKSRFQTIRDTVSMQNDFTFAAEQLLTVGFDYQGDRVAGTTNYDVTSRDNQGLFAQYQGDLGSHSVLLSLRRDDNEQFAEHTTGGVAWGYPLANRLKLTANYGTAFKAPTFNELYYPNFGSSDLQPEESESVELGLRQLLAKGHWTIALFATQVDQLIAYDANVRASSNINKARIHGLEATLTSGVSQWEISANITLLKAENRSERNKGNDLPRRAGDSFRMQADRQLSFIDIGLTLRVAGKRYNDLANTQQLDSYATVDLRSAYKIAKHWQLQGRIENLFDEDYQTASYYNQPGRGLFLSLRYQP